MSQCNACPFNFFSEESNMAQNYGCLPDPGYILKAKDEHNINWTCHSNPNKVCYGLKERRNTENGILIEYEKWYRGEQIIPEIK